MSALEDSRYFREVDRADVDLEVVAKLFGEAIIIWTRSDANDVRVQERVERVSSGFRT